MTALLTTYWLGALLAGGFVLLLALPFIWLRGKIEEYSVRAAETRQFVIDGVNLELEQIRRVFWTEMALKTKRLSAISEDFSNLKSRLDLLDKPSNDKALENIAVILKKKISKQPTKLIRPKAAKANGRSHASR